MIPQPVAYLDRLRDERKRAGVDYMLHLGEKALPRNASNAVLELTIFYDDGGILRLASEIKPRYHKRRWWEFWK